MSSVWLQIILHKHEFLAIHPFLTTSYRLQEPDSIRLLFTASTRITRLLWNRRHQSSTPQYWGCVSFFWVFSSEVFSSESDFNMKSEYCRERTRTLSRENAKREKKSDRFGVKIFFVCSELFEEEFVT